MTTIYVTVTDQKEVLIFPDVDYYYETRRGLEIIQEEMYHTSKTVIMKDNILRYSVMDKRA